MLNQLLTYYFEIEMYLSVAFNQYFQLLVKV